MSENEQPPKPENIPATPEENNIIEGFTQYVNDAQETRLDPEDELLEEKTFNQTRNLPRIPPIPDGPPSPTAQKREEIRPPKPRPQRNS